MTLSVMQPLPRSSDELDAFDDAIEDTLARIGCRLRRMRIDHGLTLREVALQSRIAASSLSRIETGMRAVSLPQLLVLAELYESSLDELAAD